MKKLVSFIICGGLLLVPGTSWAYHDGSDCDWNGNCRGDSYSHDYSNQDRNRNRDRERGAFSPGPFDRSPVEFAPQICMPGATCYANPPEDQGQRSQQEQR